MQYIDTETNQYPLSEWEIRQANPNTSFTVPFDASPRYMPVQDTPRPEFDPLTQKAVEQPPAEVNGIWTQQWVVQPMTDEEKATVARAIQNDIVSNTQKRLDDFARTRNYDGILSACTYATSTVPKFAAEGQYCVNARDNTWATLYTILAEVQAGTRPMPSGYADIEPLLPVLEWPA